MTDKKKLRDERDIVDIDLDLIEEELELDLEPEDDEIPVKKAVDKQESKPVNVKRRTADTDMLDPEDSGNSKKRKLPKFWMGVGIYAGVLLVLAIAFLIYTYNCLVKYENAQPGNVVNNYLKTFESKVKDKSIGEEMTLPTGASKYESSDAYMTKYLAQFEGDKAYSSKKNPGSYSTETPVYDIYAGDDVVAHITLNAKGTKTIFAILTIMDWEIKSIEPVCNNETYNYVIKTLDNYTVKINDVAVGKDESTGTPKENPDFKYVSEYVDMPKIVEYKVEGFVNEPTIKVYDGNNNEVACQTDSSGNITALGTPVGAAVPQERSELALEMAKMWSNFTTRDLTGGKYGLDTIRKYLIKDSYYWKMATDYAGGVDITFVSAHTLKPNPYSNVKVSDYVAYGENCFSCHIYFDKAMHLTKTGATVVETVNSTFYFVKYDDSDDGVNNPHWAIVDMIATTE
ncbi:MAG: hypothetical protein IJB96_09400 [Lachnospira sp.]|nr:hypothetical protein [Lachnospira sp.]